MDLWGRIEMVSKGMYFVIVLLMLMLAVLGIALLFANAVGYEQSYISSDQFVYLLGDVLFLMVILELSKTIIIYATQHEFYLQGIVTAVLIAVCRNIIFIKFEDKPDVIYSAVAAAIIVLALLVVLKYAPTRLQSPLPKNMCEMNITMKDKPGALASVAGIIAKNGGNIMSGRIAGIGEGKSIWVALVDVSKSDAKLIEDDLKRNEFVEDLEFSSEDA
ncbi:MAG: hypothetical protein A7316_05120 [Candidatus Altiarchaeales archaeon WOR_SM1_86-2]|nr:MAG: hypothetical protein A7316_05120 [Candidatus Altiarchaeales archaeon WOR_SM1_86-2]